ncbi:tyrosine-type recombinase/integrase [Clostridium thailandense]|uniref:tyrosine-type recombinase/integrase n=1 Tax=Clostridium thailandense TaxID=2794346 RepID=UPI0039896B7C
MPSKSRKRGNNEGTIYKRPDGKWCAQITIGRSENGKIKRQSFYGKTRQEVADKLSKAQNGLRTGTLVEPNKLNLGKWLDTWLLEYKRNNIKPSTFERYESIIRNNLKPNLGSIPLKDLQPEHIQRTYNIMLKGDNKGSKALTPATIHRIHNVLHSALEQALRNNLITRNVSSVVVLPREIKKEAISLSIEDQKKFLLALDGERLRCAFVIEMASGVRLGELLALRWANVSLDKNTISIKESIRRTKNFDDSIETNTSLMFSTPKTRAGVRVIPLPPSAIEELREHRTRQNEEKIANKIIYEDNDLVFCSELGRAIDPRHFTKIFYRIRKKAGLNHFNFHILRHTYATRLIENKEGMKVVQELLGHSDVALTINTYCHVMPNVKKSAARKINFLFKNKLKPKIKNSK